MGFTQSEFSSKISKLLQFSLTFLLIFPKGSFVHPLLSKKGVSSFSSMILFSLLSVPLAPWSAQATPSIPGTSTTALVFTVSVSDATSGRTPVARAVTYTISDQAMRIDAPSKGNDHSYIWNLSTKTVASLDNEHKTFHSDSLVNIMGFVDFSQLLGQNAGNNPKDQVVQGHASRSVSGIPCTDTTILHRFKGRVVGMINGDQKIVQCLTTDFPGNTLYREFQVKLASLAKKSSKVPPAGAPVVTPLSLETVRTTDYSKGFLVKILSTLHLYDSSKIPSRQIEREKVTSLEIRQVSSTVFSIPASYKKETAPAS